MDGKRKKKKKKKTSDEVEVTPATNAPPRSRSVISWPYTSTYETDTVDAMPKCSGGKQVAFAWGGYP